MKTTQFAHTSRAFMWIPIFVGVVVFGTTVVVANPGLIPTLDSEAAHVDFSNLPNGSPVRHGFEAWQAQGWTSGTHCMQLARSGAYLDVAIEIPERVLAAQLTLVHRSGFAPGCARNGFAPVTVTVNGAVLARGFVPPADGTEADGFTTNRWDVASLLVPGRNQIRVTTEELCSVYEINRLGLAMTSGAARWIEACQMTHGIAANQPTDRATMFTSTDGWAVCWTKAASEAIGRRIEFRFYDPSGGRYFVTERTADRYNWGYIHVAGWRAATLQGQWRVDVYVSGEFQLSVPFHIGSAGCGWAPRITSVEFPSAVRANGERACGYVSFYDPDGDITRVTFEPVEGFFSGFEFDPNVEGRNNGRFSFYAYTRLVQRVTLEVILYDRQGNESEPYCFTFNAQ
jgi:hypothetical protein